MTVTIIEGALSIAAEEEEALALAHLRNMIADCEVWRAIVAQPGYVWSDLKTLADAATSDRDDAIDAIHYDRIDDEGQSQTVPAVLIRHAEEDDFIHQGGAQWDITASFYIEMNLEIPSDYRSSTRLATVDFLNKIGRFRRELLANTNAPGYLSTVRVSRGLMGEIAPDENNGQRVRTASWILTYDGSTP